MAVGCLILGDEKWYSLINEIGSTYMYYNTPSLKDVQVKQYNTTPYLMITFIEILYINAQSSMRVCQENTITQPEDMKCHSEQQVFLGDTGIVMALDTKNKDYPDPRKVPKEGTTCQTGHGHGGDNGKSKIPDTSSKLNL